MKKLFLSLLFTIALAAGSFAQLTEGHISYKVEITSDNPDMQMLIGMMQGSTMEMYFKDKNTRSEMKMGTMMTMTTITNETSGQVLMLMNGMGQQNAIKTSLEEMDKDQPEGQKVEVTLVNETKVIEGYTCKKAILTTEEGNESVFWYTEEIDVAKKGQSYLNEEVPGFPMQFEINNEGMKMTMTVTKLEKKVEKADQLFKMTIPAGYKEMTLEEMKSMGMGM